VKQLACSSSTFIRARPPACIDGVASIEPGLACFRELACFAWLWMAEDEEKMA
jgi:hypothetical protein